MKMKIKKIRIKTKNEFFADILTSARAIDGGRKARPLRGEYFESLDAVRNFLTERRLELWRLIRDEHPHSILELAHRVKRDFKSVHRDVSVLVAAGIVALHKGKGRRGDTQTPTSLADTLVLEVA